MSNKTFLTLHGGIYLMFALALFFVPDLMWPMYGVEINDQYAYFLSQHTSIFLGGIATICLMLREIESDVVAKQLLIALVITNLLGVIITFYAGVKGIFIDFGWSDPVFFAMLSVMGYLQLKKQ
ncbi:hypothetical protein [Vibrio vulnificus]|uniref:hypothetical protein n=1 Tax=Vibrio vulnificus TaxID=672 RepID=UPI00186584C3|nr:hypothetical protein [Vibrio vulnificus]EGR7942950.1 hypothetical protein [Vibrio vulnificus]ELV8667244.1 hypothetical protein [Vibrio vulnificus]MCU8409724.1 hypothetical protein [Vibrio vulnificus]HAS8326138.1 hypothetical protein [Vibrio vulnificus]